MLVRSVLVKYGTSVFLHGPRLAVLAHLNSNRNSNFNSKPSCNPNYYMEQATFGEIAYSDWLRHVTCLSVSFRIGPVRITGFVSHFGYKGTTKENFEKPQKFNSFSKISDLDLFCTGSVRTVKTSV